MAQLFLVDMHNSSRKSTETIYEIKAPLATFDTIDLDDDQISIKSLRIEASGSQQAEKGIKESGEIESGLESQGSSFDYSSEKEAGTPTPDTAAVSADTCIPDTLAETPITAVSADTSIPDTLAETPITAVSADTSGPDTLTETPITAVSADTCISDTQAAENATAEASISERSIAYGVGNASTSDSHVSPVHHMDVSSAVDTDSSNTVQSEPETVCETKPGVNNNMDPNSSENNASAEEIQTKLKIKGRKHKEKATNVKYEKIDNSDISDHEKSSPLPKMKLQMDHSKVYSTDSDSSDSDDSYVRGAFVSTGTGTFVAKQCKPGLQYLQDSHRFATDSVDSDSTPYSSPKIRRPTLPPPLSKEDAEKKSKRKAYEKRLQRLQVTTNPIERPRSTTPINIYGLEEYASISSPDRSPSGSLEKLKITLPQEEVCRTRSPRRQHRSGTPNSSDTNAVFSFNEDLLFTHTKSAILLDDDEDKGVSPKRILVPPTLSPKLSPAQSPRHSTSLGPNKPRYYYSPGTRRQAHNRGSSLDIPPEFFTNTSDHCEQWAKFDTLPADTKTSENNSVDGTTCQFEENNFADFSNSFADKSTDRNGDTVDSKMSDSFVDTFDSVFSNKTNINNAKEKVLNTEEVLTISIAGCGESRTCDVSCDAINTTNMDNTCAMQMDTDNNTQCADADNSQCADADNSQCADAGDIPGVDSEGDSQAHNVTSEGIHKENEAKPTITAINDEDMNEMKAITDDSFVVEDEIQSLC